MNNKYFWTVSALVLIPSLAYSAIDCNTVPSCSSMNYTDPIADCSGDYVVCPFDTSIGKCIHSAEIGQIVHFPSNPNGSTSSYKGWVFCDGRTLSVAQYPELAAFLGSTYGGDGKTTFAVPNYKNDYIRIASATGSSKQTRQPPRLPSLYTQWNSFFEDKDLTNSQWGEGAISSKAYDDTSGYQMEMNGDCASGYLRREFDASYNNAIYGNGSSFYNSDVVRLANVPTLPYIYAGRKSSSASSSKNIPSGCAQGYYYYTDGTCSQTRNTSKTLKGIISYYYSYSSSSYSYVRYIWGGNSTASTKEYAEDNCQYQNGSIASPSTAATTFSKASGFTSNVSPVYLITTGRTYWVSSTSNYGYSCTSTTSCSTYITNPSYAYYYCEATDYFY